MAIINYVLIDFENVQPKNIEILKSVVHEKQVLLDKQKDIIDFYSDKRKVLNEKNIIYWMDKFGVKSKKIVLAQIKLETGHFTSKICTENNNLTGMKLPRVRKTTAIGENRGHAKYNSWIDSIRDIRLFQDYYNVGDDCYYTFLERIGYAQNSQYIKLLKTIV